LMVFASDYIGRLASGMNAFSTVVAGAQAIVTAYGVSIAPPLAIASALYSLFLSQGAQAIQAWLNPQTEDQITKALYCGITSQSLITANHFASLISAEMDSDANKATWFANCARMLGDDLTNRIWRLGAADPSNACELYNCETYADDEFLLDFRSEPNGVGYSTINNWYPAVWQPGGWRPADQTRRWGHIFRLDQDLWDQVKQRFSTITRITFYHGGVHTSNAFAHEISLRSSQPGRPNISYGFSGANRPSPQVVDNLNWTIANSTLPHVWFGAYIVSHIVLKGILH